MEKLPKREYPVERVIGRGFDEEDFEIARKLMKGRFEEQDITALKERQKTPEETTVIQQANEATNVLLERYGARPLDIPPKNVHIIPPEDWPKNRENASAFYEFFLQAIAYKDLGHKTALAHRTFHEMLHIKFHQAAQFVENDSIRGFMQYRSGLNLSSPKRHGQAPYFHKLNEAVIETLAIEYWKNEIEQNPEYADEIKEIHVFKKELLEYIRTETAGFTSFTEEEVRELYFIDYLKESGKYLFGFFSYAEERAALKTLIRKISERTATPEKEVFDMFAKCAATGHMVELTKLVDGCFGKGSYKKLGEVSRGESFFGEDGQEKKPPPPIKDLLDFIQSL